MSGAIQAKAEDVAKASVRRGRQLSDGREAQLIGAAVLVVGLLLLWRRRRRQR
jgi:MYXO-CTERM domain-containing protein